MLQIIIAKESDTQLEIVAGTYSSDQKRAKKKDVRKRVGNLSASLASGSHIRKNILRYENTDRITKR